MPFISISTVSYFTLTYLLSPFLLLSPSALPQSFLHSLLSFPCLTYYFDDCILTVEVINVSYRSTAMGSVCITERNPTFRLTRLGHSPHRGGQGTIPFPLPFLYPSPLAFFISSSLLFLVLFISTSFSPSPLSSFSSSLPASTLPFCFLCS